MSVVALTGGNGFLGWHTRAALRERGEDARRIDVGEAFNLEAAIREINGASRLVHVAGINRGDDSDVHDGNLFFATQIAEALRHAERPPKVVAYANSIQASNSTIYGRSKAEAGEILARAAADVGSKFLDLQLPNLFGEHGQPFYNAVTATFSHLLARGGMPTVEQDRELTLLHAQSAADLLLGTLPPQAQAELEEHESVSGLLMRLENISRVYARGEIPDITSSFDRDLFNTYRSYTSPDQTPVALTKHADTRGSFFEVLRTHGGQGQYSFSTTAPGISRGDHFHRRKVERFTVLSGSATISMRRLFHNEVFEFEVNGDEPVSVDMPTLWSHNIVNTGTEVLYTSFWTNDLYDPNRPDTILEVV